MPHIIGSVGCFGGGGAGSSWLIRPSCSSSNGSAAPAGRKWLSSSKPPPTLLSHKHTSVHCARACSTRILHISGAALHTYDNEHGRVKQEHIIYLIYALWVARHFGFIEVNSPSTSAGALLCGTMGAPSHSQFMHAGCERPLCCFHLWPAWLYTLHQSLWGCRKVRGERDRA